MDEGREEREERRKNLPAGPRSRRREDRSGWSAIPTTMERVVEGEAFDDLGSNTTRALVMRSFMPLVSRS